MEINPMFVGMPWFGWIAIVAIVSGTITTILKMRMTHHERIEMVRQGMHPDMNLDEAKSRIPEL